MTAPRYPAEEAAGIWVVVEVDLGRVQGVSWELLGKARELADTRPGPDGRARRVTAVVPGYRVGHLAAEAVASGADAVLLADDPALALYRTEPYASVVARLVMEGKPEILLVGATPNGRDLAGRLAVRLRTGLTADCVALGWDEATGLLAGENTGFGGGVIATITCPRHRPQMFTVRPGIFPAPEPDPRRKGTVRRRRVVLAEADQRVAVVEQVASEAVDLTRAPVIVAAGRGARGLLPLIQELAALLGGEVGATRVPVDEGWVDRGRQIGQTGYVTRPKLAVVCGASGAMQFTVGIEAARTIVAINTDPEAPIFEVADVCVVDDLQEVLPPLIEALRRPEGVTP